MIITTEFVYLSTILVICLGCALKGLELIAISNLTKPDQVSDWELVGIDFMQESRAAKIFGAIYSHRGFNLLCAAAIVLACMIVTGLVGPTLKFSFFILFFLQFIIHHRQEFGGDGADQMHFLICCTIAVCFCFSSAPNLHEVGILFIAAQLTLSYAVAGVAKLFSREWRSGQAIQGILSSYTYGTKTTKAILGKRHGLAQTACWIVIISESAFPLAFFCNEKIFLAAILMMISMHLFIGVVMGLNDFIVSFLAAYPSVLFVYFTYFARSSSVVFDESLMEFMSRFVPGLS